VHNFHAKTAILISDFSQTSSMWHALILRDLLIQYENNNYFLVTKSMGKIVIFFIDNEALSAILNFQLLPISFPASYLY
jgi:hypothetical protein